MTEQEKKRQVAKISVFITSIFVIFLSISYAFINQTLTGTKRQVITTRNLQLELKEGEAITLENTLPMYDEVGMIQKSFDFTLTNKANLDTNYALKLVDITPDGAQKLDTSVVKYGLEKDGVISKNLLSNLVDNIIDSGTLAANGTINYNLRLWIDASVEDEALIKGKSLSYRIEVLAEQIREISYKGMIESRGTEVIEPCKGCLETIPSTKKYYQYSAQISHIVIEDKIDIPDTIETDKQWDVSEKQDGTVMAYLEKNESEKENENTYRLHIQANGKVYANPDCSYLFSSLNIEQFDGLENFDTSNTTNMSNMFSFYSSSAPLDLSNFNTSNVTDMSYMFRGYSNSAPLDLSKFDTSNVTDMTSMFYRYSSSASLDLSNFNTPNVTDMSYMFTYYSGSAPLDLSNFNISNVTDMAYMFSYYSGGTLTIGDWKTGKHANLSFMFSNYSSSQPLDLSSFDTSNVTNMSSMFSDYSSSQPLDLSKLNTSNVTNMDGMFYSYRSSQPLDLSKLNTSKVTDMSNMFYSYSGGVLTIENWDTSNVTDMSWMFSYYSGSALLDLSNFNTSNVTNMFAMFSSYSSSAALDISSFDFSKVTNKTSLFYRNSAYYASSILVKDEAMKTWVLEQNSNLTNVTIKGASG